MFVAGQLVKEAGIGTSIEGIPAGSDFFKPLIVVGRWFVPGDGRVVVITRDAAKKNNIHVGDIVTLDLGELGKDQWQVVGSLRSGLRRGLQLRHDLCAAGRALQGHQEIQPGHAAVRAHDVARRGLSRRDLTTQLKNLYRRSRA